MFVTMMTAPTPSAGRAVKAVLALRGMPQSELARRIGIDDGTLSRVLRGQLQRPLLWQAIWNELSSEDAPAARSAPASGTSPHETGLVSATKSELP
jgi:hypothetical protein